MIRRRRKSAPFLFGAILPVRAKIPPAFAENIRFRVGLKSFPHAGSSGFARIIRIGKIRAIGEFSSPAPKSLRRCFEGTVISPAALNKFSALPFFQSVMPGRRLAPNPKRQSDTQCKASPKEGDKVGDKFDREAQIIEITEE